MIELDPCASRTVTPRKLTKPCTRDIYALDSGGYVLTEHGERLTFEEYARGLDTFDSHIFVCFSAETWLWTLHEHWRRHPLWSWRVSVTDKHGNKLQTKRVAYYGFRDEKKKNNRYHVVLNAASFFRKQDVTVTDLITLGRTIREFCNAHGLELRASAAGIAAQLLRQPDFYPYARRRVPHFINETVRPHLPGGHFEAYTDTGQRVESALYIDQESAHHYAAETTPLPNSNSVRAIGYTRADKRYARAGGRLFAREMRKHGLIKATIFVPNLPPKVTRFAPRLMHEAGERVAYVWTNELPYLQSLGLEVRNLVAVWGTDEIDDGLVKYAQWARDAQQRYPALKALLLMPYGLLARRRSVVTYHHPGGNAPMILANQYLDDTKAHRVETQPDTANALQLGLIQAFVRTLSLDMARQLTANKHEVISVYADGIFVRLANDKSIPMFTPWRVKEGHTLELNDSLRVPVRARVRRDYVPTTKE